MLILPPHCNVKSEYPSCALHSSLFVFSYYCGAFPLHKRNNLFITSLFPLILFHNAHNLHHLLFSFVPSATSLSVLCNAAAHCMSEKHWNSFYQNFTLFSFLFHSDFIHFDFLLSAHHPGTRISEQSQLLIRWLKSPACGEGNVRGLPPVEGQFQNPYSVFVLMWLRLNRCRHRLCMSSPILQRFPLLLNEFPLLGSNTL